MIVYMFVTAMSGIYIHKASNKYVILALALLLYVSFFMFLLVFDGFPKQNNHSSISYALVMNDEWESVNTEDFINSLKQDHFKDNFVNYRFKDRVSEWKRLSDKMDISIENNPLHNIFIIECFDKIDGKVISELKKDKDSVSIIKVLQSKISTSKSDMTNWKLILLPLIVLSFLLYFNILQGATQSNLSSNKRVIESLVVAGAHHSKLSAVFRKNGINNVIISITLAVILFLTTIYLIMSGFHLNFKDFKFIIGLKSILIPALIMLVIHTMLLLWKVDKYIKSI